LSGSTILIYESYPSEYRKQQQRYMVWNMFKC